jgi:RNA polymerase sigma-70 factor (ECF subfamily)
MLRARTARTQSLKELPDNEVVSLAQKGDQEAFAELYERFLPVVYKRVRYVVPAPDVEDVTQEIFIAVINSLESFNQKSKFSTWLRTLVNRRVADYYRKREAANSYSHIEITEVSERLVIEKGGTLPGTSQTDKRIILIDAMRELPGHYQEVLLLRFAEGLKFADVADQMGKSLEATKSLFRRAVDALKIQMEL